MLEEKQNLHELSLAQLVSRVCRLSGDRLRVIIEGIGLHKGQAFILFHLWNKDGMAQREIASHLHISPATVTSTLKRMERDGWIKRQRDSRDQRVVRVYLTAKANALHERIKQSFDALDTELKSVLTRKEEEDLTGLLIKLHKCLAPAKSSKASHSSATEETT